MMFLQISVSPECCELAVDWGSQVCIQCVSVSAYKCALVGSLGVHLTLNSWSQTYSFREMNGKIMELV